MTLGLLGRPVEAVSLIGAVALARERFLVPAVKARVDQEGALLGTVPRCIMVSPLGEDVTALGGYIMARGLLYPFSEG